MCPIRDKTRPLVEEFALTISTSENLLHNGVAPTRGRCYTHSLGGFAALVFLAILQNWFENKFIKDSEFDE